MQPSIPWSSCVSVFVIERMVIIHFLKCTVPFSFVVPLLSLAVTHCHLLSLVVILAVTGCTTRCHLLYHSLYHSLSLDVPLVCLFINDRINVKICVKQNLIFCAIRKKYAQTCSTLDLKQLTKHPTRIKCHTPHILLVTLLPTVKKRLHKVVLSTLHYLTISLFLTLGKSRE